MAAKKKAAKKAAKKSTRKQPDIPGIGGPGVGGVQIDEVDNAAADYVRVRDRRQDLTKLEVAAKQRLIDALHQNEKEIGRDGEHVLRYRHDDLLVELMPEGEKLRVRKGQSDEQE